VANSLADDLGDAAYGVIEATGDAIEVAVLEVVEPMRDEAVEQRVSQAKAVIDEKETEFEEKVEEFKESNEQMIESWEENATGSVAVAGAHILAEAGLAANAGTATAAEGLALNIAETAKGAVDAVGNAIKEIEVLAPGKAKIEEYETKAEQKVEEIEEAVSGKIEQCEDAISGAIDAAFSKVDSLFDAALSKVNSLYERFKCC